MELQEIQLINDLIHILFIAVWFRSVILSLDIFANVLRKFRVRLNNIKLLWFCLHFGYILVVFFKYLCTKKTFFLVKFFILGYLKSLCTEDILLYLKEEEKYMVYYQYSLEKIFAINNLILTEHNRELNICLSELV